MSETKIKKNQINISGTTLGINEFVVTEDIFNTYKIQGYDDNYYLNLAQLIEDKNLSNINLNEFNAFLDNYTMTNSYFVIKNGRLLLDNIEEGGCERALALNNTYLHIEDVTIKAPQCEADDTAIIEITNSSLSFSNCDIQASTNTNNKVFIKLMTTDTNHCDVQLLGTSLNYDAFDDSGNIEFTFIKTTSNNCHVEIKDCNRLRVANDVGEANCKFLQTDTDTTVDLNIYNSTIVMEGLNIGDCLNVNLDNNSINANNNTFIGRLVTRYETAEQTVSEKGFPNTLEEEEQIWDLGVIPERDWKSMEEFYLDDMWTFFSKANIDPNDMSKAWERFEFSIREISNQRGFILNYDESKTYTTDDFEDLEEWGCVFDGNLEDYDIGRGGVIEIHPYEQRYRANEEVTYESGFDFQEKIQEGKISYSAKNIYQFNNNTIRGYVEGHGIFQNASGRVICSSLLTNTGEIEFGDLWSKQEGQTLVCRDGKFRPEYISGGSNDGWQYIRNHDELMDVINNQDHADLDFSQFDYSTFDRNGYTLEDKNYNIRKLNIKNEEWCLEDFEFFSKPVFIFKNCNIWFEELSVNIDGADFNNPQNPTPLFDTINEHQYYNVDFENCNIHINQCRNISELCILKLDNIRASFKNTECHISGNAENEGTEVFIPNGYLVKQIMNVTDQERFNNPNMSEINIKNSTFNIDNFGINCACIKYVNNAPTRMNIEFSNLGADIQDDQYKDNALTLALPNGNSDRQTEVYGKYSRFDKISMIPADDSFTTWKANTPYDKNNCLEFVNLDESSDKRYVRVIKPFTSGDASWEDFWDNMNNGNIEWYYRISVNGEAVSGFDPFKKINIEKRGTFNFAHVNLDELNIDNQLEVNNENWRLEIRDQNINASDALNAIKELARRVKDLEDR